MTIARVIAVVSSVLLLASCVAPAAPPASAPTPTVTASPTPTPSPTPVLTTITLNAESAIASDQNGQTLATLDYYARGVDVATQLTALFAFAPAIEVVDPIGSDFAFSGTKYDWEGFTLFWYYGYEDDPSSGNGSYPDGAPVRILVEVPSIRGVTIQATDGVRVGDGQGDLSTLYPGDTDTFVYEGRLIETALVSCVEHPELQGFDPGLELPRNCVVVWADPAEGPVTRIGAPMKVNYGL